MESVVSAPKLIVKSAGICGAVIVYLNFFCYFKGILYHHESDVQKIRSSIWLLLQKLGAMPAKLHRQVTWPRSSEL